MIETATLPVTTASQSRSLAALAVPLAFGLAPVLTWLLTASPNGAVLVPETFWIKALAVPTIAAELITILLAGRTTWAGSDPLRGWPRLALLALGLIAFATILWAPTPFQALMRTTFWVIHILFAAAIARLCAAGVVRASAIMTAMGAGMLAMAVLTVGVAIHPTDPARADWVNGLPGFDHLRRIGYYAAPIGAIAAGQIAIAPQRHGRAFWPVVLAVAVTLTAWSGSRGGMVALGGAIVGAFILFPDVRRWKALLTIVISVATGALLTLILPRAGAAWGFDRMIDSGSDSSGRTALWLDTLHTALARPLFGYGEGQTFSVVETATHYGVLHPHNLPLQLLLAWGVIGSILFVAVGAVLARRIIADIRSGGHSGLPAAAGIVALLIFAIYDGTFFHVQASATAFACLGMALAVGAERRA